MEVATRHMEEAMGMAANRIITITIIILQPTRPAAIAVAPIIATV